jgi:hypothetical protein
LVSLPGEAAIAAPFRSGGFLTALPICDGPFLSRIDSPKNTYNL